MGILTAIQQRDPTPPAVTPNLTPPCLTCHGLDRWLDSYGRWHCFQCDPPLHESLVREIAQGVLQSTPEAPAAAEPGRTDQPAGQQTPPADWTEDDWQAVSDPLRPGKKILYNRRLVLFDGRRFLHREFGWEIGPPLGTTWEEYDQRFARQLTPH